MPEPSPEAVEALFQQATDIEPAHRRAFLDEKCAGDPDLRAAVDELLRFDAKAENNPDFLPSPAADVRAALPRSVAGAAGKDRPLSNPPPARRRGHGHRL